MAEIKTCEQYVLEKLADAEHSIELLQIQLDNTHKRATDAEKKLDNLLDVLERNGKWETSVDGNTYFDFDLWDKYDEDDYVLFRRILEERHDG